MRERSDMKVPRRAIFFGRFQPFHLGHLHVAGEILKKFDEIVFLIGMSSESHTERNPFTAGERIEMIRLAMNEAGYPLSKVITANLHTMEIHIASAHHVVYASPKAEAIYVGNPIMARIFKEAGFNVVVPTPYRREIYNGSLIRAYMKANSQKWKELVSKDVAEFIESINGPERVRAISAPEERHITENENHIS